MLAVPKLGGGGLWLLGRAPPLPAAPAGLLICGRRSSPRPADSILCAQIGAKIRLGWKERDAGAATAGLTSASAHHGRDQSLSRL